MKSTDYPLSLIEKLRNLPSMNYIIYPSDPGIHFSSPLRKNIPGEETIINHIFTVPERHYVIITPIDKNQFIKFIPRNKDNLNIVDGRMTIERVKINSSGEIIELYKGPTGEVIWQEGTICLPGDQIWLKFLHPTLELDEKNSILQMGVEVKKED